MKGVVLMGGTGSRLLPLTKVTNKHLLPVGRRVMGDYPVDKLAAAGIRDIMIVTGAEHAGAVIGYFGSGADRGCDFTYRVQDTAGGIAAALWLARDFAAGGSVCVILGDNLFEDDLTTFAARFAAQGGGARVLLKEVRDPERFGVAECIDNRIVGIEEKPLAPKSSLAVTGIYFYGPDVFEIIQDCRPSGRGELEITDVNNAYIARGAMQFDVLKGWWTDAGTFESLARANSFVGGSR